MQTFDNINLRSNPFIRSITSIDINTYIYIYIYIHIHKYLHANFRQYRSTFKTLHSLNYIYRYTALFSILFLRQHTKPFMLHCRSSCRPVYMYNVYIYKYIFFLYSHVYILYICIYAYIYIYIYTYVYIYRYIY
jgi:hypothetical protein